MLETLRENAEEALQVKGGSAVANRALELLGNQLGLFKEPEQKLPVNLEDLPTETLESGSAGPQAEAKRRPRRPRVGMRRRRRRSTRNARRKRGSFGVR